MRKTVGLWIGILALAASAAQASPGDGLQSRVNNQAWEGLKGRLSVSTATPYRADIGSFDANDSQKINSLSVMGDYYLSRPLLGNAGGLRATSGLLLGPRASLWSSPATVDRRTADSNTDGAGPLPYLGVGYTGLSDKGGWGVSADLGLMASPRSGVRLGKVFNGSQSLDDTLRDMRFAPLVQVGVSYSF